MMQAWDVTLFFDEDHDTYFTQLGRDNLLTEIRNEFPLAYFTEVGCARSYATGEWRSGHRIWIDTTYAGSELNRQYVTRLLLGYDSYPSNIEIFKA